MYDEFFNPDDFEEESFEELDVEFPIPKERPSLDEMIRKYGIIIFELVKKELE